MNGLKTIRISVVFLTADQVRVPPIVFQDRGKNSN